jgi:hypothetical protein
MSNRFDPGTQRRLRAPFLAGRFRRGSGPSRRSVCSTGKEGAAGPRRLACLPVLGLACALTAWSSAVLAQVAVGPDDPVITVDGFCPDRTAATGACETEITRAQFDKLIDALQPDMPWTLRLKVANAYARNLRMSAAAEKRGLDKTAAFAEEMRFARMQLLSQDLDRALHAEADNVRDADVENYYKSNQASYEQATVARIFIPHSKIPPANADARTVRSAGAQADAEAMNRLAGELRARAQSGEEPDQLQLEAYAEAGTPRASVNTRLEQVRRSSLPPAHESIFGLAEGQVSEVFSDPGGAHFIYKMIGKRTLSLDDARVEIRTTIATQRYRESTKSFQVGMVFSDAYFNPPVRSAQPSARAHRDGVHNPAQASQHSQE